MAYTPNPNRAIKGGKAVVSAQELADFREKFGKDKTLRDLLNMDKGLQRKLEIPKSMRNLPDNESNNNAPIRIPKSMRNLPANERDSNTADKTAMAMDTFKIPTKGKSAISREAGMSRGTRSEEYKKGGKVSSASSRADGCAVKGKTKGRMV
jgi:hypothetical protein